MYIRNICNMGMRDLSDMYAQSRGLRHAYQANHKNTCYKCYVSLRCHSNNTSGLNLASNCHTCLQGYKYKLLMPYSQGVEYLHLAVIHIRKESVQTFPRK